MENKIEKEYKVIANRIIDEVIEFHLDIVLVNTTRARIENDIVALLTNLD